MSKFGEQLREARKKAGLSQVQLAALTGLSKSTICNYERGKRENVSAPVMHALADALNIRIPDLFGVTYEVIDENVIIVNSTPEYERFAERMNEESMRRVHELEKENQLLNAFYALNNDGQNEAVKRVQELAEIHRYQRENE